MLSWHLVSKWVVAWRVLTGRRWKALQAWDSVPRSRVPLSALLVTLSWFPSSLTFLTYLPGRAGEGRELFFALTEVEAGGRRNFGLKPRPPRLILRRRFLGWVGFTLGLHGLQRTWGPIHIITHPYVYAFGASIFFSICGQVRYRSRVFKYQ